nr:hypothetical protein RchiOBHm_Chr4g0441131 [Ipomoea trifida]
MSLIPFNSFPRKMASLTRRVFMAFVVCLLVTTMGSKAACSRLMNGEDFGRVFAARLPRGPVPPSDPSPCHNYKTDHFVQNNNFPGDYVICP